MLRASLDAKLDGYVGRHGGPSAFLHLGPKQTGEIAAAITARTTAGTGTLHQRLLFRAPDTLAYSDNHAARPNGADRSDELVIDGLCSVIKDNGDGGNPGQLIYVSLKDRTGIYHFHDTTLAAPVRTAGYLEDSRLLHGDAGNLAAFLYRLRQTQPGCHQRIRSTVRMAASFFDDFSLAPRSLDPRRILLNWKQLGSDYELGPHQLSDGTLRFMALTALLLQPAATVRLEPFCDLGFLTKPDRDRFEYRTTDRLRNWLARWQQVGGIDNFLHDRFFAALAASHGWPARLADDEQATTALTAAGEDLKSSLGYSPIVDVALLAAARLLTEQRIVLEIGRATELLKALQKRDPAFVRFTVDRMGTMAYVKFLKPAPGAAT